MWRKYIVPPLCFALLMTVMGAGTKEEIMQLQSDVLQLQNKIIDLQKSLDASTRATRDLLIQIKDDVGVSSAGINDVKKRLQNQQVETDATVSDLVKKINGISDKLDNFDQRLSAMAKQIQDLKLQTAAPSPMVGGTSGPAPPADELYNTAMKDYLSGNFELAQQGFETFLRYYSNTDRAVEARFYLGQSYYGLKKYDQAIKVFDELADAHPTADVTAAALLKAGLAFMDSDRRQEAIVRFRSLIDKFPNTNEAGIARQKLTLLGVDAKSRAPSRARPTNKRRN